METMRAAVFEAVEGTEGTLTVQDVPVPEPGPKEVLVRVEACGICLSDVHLLDGTLPAGQPVVIPGHEAAGVVERTGELVAGWEPGDRVVIAGGRPCRSCRRCVAGRLDDCQATELMGFAYNGAWAEYVAVPSDVLVPVPEQIPFEQAAILADAVSTPYAGLVDRGGLRPAEAVGVWGVGGLGVHAVQIARMVGAAPVIAVDPNPAARARALAAGADHAIDPASGDVRTKVLDLTGGNGVDLAVDLAGGNAVLEQGYACLASAGRLLMIGLSMDPLHLGPGLFLGLRRQSVLGHLGYAKRHLEEVVTLVAHGRLDVSASVSGVLPLEEVSEGVRRLAAKDGDPVRLMVRPAG